MADEDTLQYGAWERDVDDRLRRLSLIQYGIGAGAMGAAVMAFMAFKGVANLAKVVGQLAQVSNDMSMRLIPPDQHDRPQRVVLGVDETPVPNGRVAEPREGPATTAGKLMKEDPIPANDLLREPEFRTGPMDVVAPDLPDLTDG